jgi:diguanylate cyclase (GGDEF)-like protein
METLDYEESIDDVHRQVFDLTTMLEIGKTLNVSLSLDDVLDIIILTCSGHFHASAAHLLLPVERRGQTFSSYPPGINEMQFGTNHPLIKHFKDNQRVIHIAEMKKLKALQDVYKHLQRDNIEIIVPLRFKYEINGILCIAKKEKEFGAHYTDDEIRYLDIIAGFASVAIENARLYEMATLDRKTGLYNHGFFQNRLVDEMERAERYKSDLSLMILDLDHFKQVNDTHGHMKGDEVLIRLAHALREQIRTYDVPARFGGEEFMVILPETDGSRALIVAERIRKSIQKLSFKSSKGKFSVTASFGIASYLHSANLTEDIFIEHSDQALYHAKENGRNQVVLYDDITEKVHVETAPQK